VHIIYNFGLYFSYFFCVVLKYIELRKPKLINDVEMQKVLMDRFETFRLLKENNVSQPKTILIDHNNNNDLIIKEDENCLKVINSIFIFSFIC
jgi:hypothetical protein